MAKLAEPRSKPSEKLGKSGATIHGDDEVGWSTQSKVATPETQI